MKLNKANTLLSLVTFLAWSSASAEIIWQADASTCTIKPAGTWAECKVVDKQIDVLQAVTPTDNEFIKAEKFITTFSLSYPCTGRQDDTYLQFGDKKLTFNYGADIVKSDFIHDFNPANPKVHFVRNSRGFSTVSSSCYLEVKDVDTVLGSTDALKVYARKLIGGLQRVRTIVDKITLASDLTTVRNALFDVQTQFKDEKTSLTSQKGNLDIDLLLADTQEEKDRIQERIDAIAVRLADVDAALGKLQNALNKLDVKCATPEGLTTPVCKGFLTETADEVAGLKDYFADELNGTPKEGETHKDILNWINGEITRLGTRQQELVAKLKVLKSLVENP